MMSLRRLGYAVLLGCLLAGTAGAEKVSEIKVRREGGGLIEDAAVLGFVSVKPGEELNRTALSRDVRALEESGRFAFVSTEVEKTPDGLTLTYVVRSKPRRIQRERAKRHTRKRSPSTTSTGTTGC